MATLRSFLDTYNLSTETFNGLVRQDPAFFENYISYGDTDESTDLSKRAIDRLIELGGLGGDGSSEGEKRVPKGLFCDQLSEGNLYYSAHSTKQHRGGCICCRKRIIQQKFAGEKVPLRGLFLRISETTGGLQCEYYTPGPSARHSAGG